MKILLLEDELMLQNAIKEYLEKLKHSIYAFSNGIQANKSLEINSYDLMILDINVPKMNGLEFCENLKINNINTPIIFISALIDIETISCAFELGANDYLKKPFHLKELSIRIEKIQKDIDSLNIKHIVLSDNYTYFSEKKELYFKNEVEVLTKKQIDIIDFLCKNLNSFVNYEMLRIYVWNNDNISDGTIRTEINRIRRTLKEDFVINQKGLGYKINKFNMKL